MMNIYDIFITLFTDLFALFMLDIYINLVPI
jgi:hypothetical protein